MAIINLLKADYNGKLGQTYGYRHKSTSVVAAVPFSHTPHNISQKSQWNAFTKLQKFCGIVSKECFKYTGLSDKKVNRINAVNTFFKPLIVNHVYNPQNIKEMKFITKSGEITDFSIDDKNFTATMAIKNSNLSEDNKIDYCVIILFDGNCESIAYKTAALPTGITNLKFSFPDKTFSYYMGLKFSYRKNKWSSSDVFFYDTK